MVCRRVITVSPSSFLLSSVSSLHLTEIHFACRERKTLLLHGQVSLLKGGRGKFSAWFWFNSARLHVQQFLSKPGYRLSVYRTVKENRQLLATKFDWYRTLYKFQSIRRNTEQNCYETNCSLLFRFNIK